VFTPMPRNNSSLYPPNVASQSRTGTRHPSNDDSCDFFAISRGDSLGAVYVAVVADGVTGTVGGAQASQIAVETIKTTLQEAPSRQETLSEWLEFAILRANEEILFEAKRNPQWQGMSTTIVLAALAGEKLYVMHLGDSRAYLLRGDALYQLVADHTWTQEAVQTGIITAQEALSHPGRNQLLRYLGTTKYVGVDRGVIALGSNQREEYLTVQPGDEILLCSDGLHGRVSEAELTQIMLEHIGYPQDAVDELVEKAVAKGERDDITAVLMALPPGRKDLTMPLRTLAVDPLPVVAKTPSASIWWWLLLLGMVAVLIFLAQYVMNLP